MKLFRLAVLPLALMTTAAYASEYDAAMRAYLDSSIRTWANDPVLVAAINAANTERAGIDQARIDNMDTAWRTNRSRPATSLIFSRPTRSAYPWMVLIRRPLLFFTCTSTRYVRMFREI